MSTNKPYCPEPDQVPDNERTGDEPNPSGHEPKKSDEQTD